MSERIRLDAVVIGGGVIGLAVARALSLAGRDVTLLEREPVTGSVTSARNSEVIHAGLHYPPGSLKARLCIDGKAGLYAYCEARGIPYRRCGKLVIAASPAEADYLERLRARDPCTLWCCPECLRRAATSGACGPRDPEIPPRAAGLRRR